MAANASGNTYLPTGQVPGAHEAAAAMQNAADVGINAVLTQFGGLAINGPAVGPAGSMHGMVPPYLAGPDGQQILYGSYAPAGMQLGYGQTSDAANAAFAAPYLPPGAYPAYLPYSYVPYQPRGLLAERSDASAKDVPGLENRRASYSTNESTPATPFFGGMAARDQVGRVAVFDRSTYTTPSPQQIISGGPIQQPKGFYAMPDGRDLDAMINVEPVIPEAVPAVFTPAESMKTLEQSLVNHIPGNRNVYIRGLHPTTDDELLMKYAERFGKVETSKAIIDTATGACKGFGFAKFYDVRDSETCIRGFYRLGYEVGFARVRLRGNHRTNSGISTAFTNRALQESFNSRLKAEGDEQSTNLYISNLPKSFGEHELATVFLGYTILSSKILRDTMGNSRGVGFARFESREHCEKVMDEYIGVKLGDEGLPMQIRYADTPNQKELKRVTAERRQFRTNEYNVGAYGTPLVGMNPTIYSQPGPRRMANVSNGYNPRGGLFDRNARSQAPSQGQTRGMGGRTPPTNVASGNMASSEDGTGDDGVTIHVDSPLVANGSTRSSPVKQEKD
ncbi:hypothetical protein F4780DRAFT_751307 [Xylariomycetidae sp. FL0641]|nr:hypothetical protein F4780DRAFT_751307 [Xylariomycetidae sp. FL0641]